MFTKLMKLANDLDSLGRFDEANEVDELIRAIAAGEIDIDEAPIDLTEEDTGPVVAPVVVPVAPQDSPEMAAMRAERDRLMQENKELTLKKMRKTPSSGIKVSPKGAVSIYGLGHWPVTLYSGQWKKLLEMKEKILQFIAENEKLLSTKG